MTMLMIMLIKIVIISSNHCQVGWQSLVVLYEHDEGLVRLQELLRLPQVIFIVISDRIIDNICKSIVGNDIGRHKVKCSSVPFPEF